VPIGSDSSLLGNIDLIKMKAIFYEGSKGEILREAEIPEGLV
jgi:elongation factor G